MKREFNILIADRNPHVRDFLRRELKEEGYRVQLVRSGQEVLNVVFNDRHLDLLILDLDIPGARELSVLGEVGKRIPTLPVIAHAFLEDYLNHQAPLSTTAFVEKKGTNIDHLKEVVQEVLRKTYPRRFEPPDRNGNHSPGHPYES